MTGAGPLEYGPPGRISPVFHGFLSIPRISLEAVEHVGQVAWRLNRVGLQRAVYRSAATILLAATLAAVCAAYLEPVWFRVLLASLVVLGLAVIATSALLLRSGWAASLEAARWVEEHVPLEDRLLTLVSASPEAQRSRLWPELVRDNQGHLARWRDERLGIPAVPADLVPLAIALVLAALFLVPWDERVEPRPEPPLLPSLPEPMGATPPEPAGRPAPAPGSAVVRGASGGATAEGPAGLDAPSALAAVDQIQADLGEAFRRSFGGQIVAGERAAAGAGSRSNRVPRRLAGGRDRRPRVRAGGCSPGGGTRPPRGRRGDRIRGQEPGAGRPGRDGRRRGAGHRPARGGTR